MKNFIKKPLIPQNPVGLCVISHRYIDIIEKLNALGIETIATEYADWLSVPVCDHADMQVFYFGKGRALVSSKSRALAERLVAHGITVEYCLNDITGEYPHDIALNCVLIGDKLLCNKKHTDSAILNFAKFLKCKIIDVKQGYAKCSSAVLGDGAVITADESLLAAYNNNGIECLRISAGGIDLPGYDYGFIGGCCGLIDKDKLFFTGDITKHADYKIIAAFCKKHATEIIYIKDRPLRDIGGLVALIEK